MLDIKMKIIRLIAISSIINILVIFNVNYTLAQDGEKVKDSTDTTLVDGVKQIQKSKELVQNSQAEVIEENPDGTIDVDLEEDTGTDRPQPRMTLEESLTRPLYQSSGKRDPFKPFIKEPKEKEAVISETTPPIKRFPLDEYRIVGIVWVDNIPKAMVVDPEKNTYFLGKSDEIGNKNGVILEVSENGILVNEKRYFEDVFGEQKVEIKKSVLAFVDDEG